MAIFSGSCLIFEGSFLHVGGEIARSPRVFFIPNQSNKNILQTKFELEFVLQGCQFSGPGNLFLGHMFQFFCVQIELF